MKNNTLIDGMCFTHRHDFGLLDENTQENIRSQMRQLYEHNIKPVVDANARQVDLLLGERANMQRTHRTTIDLYNKQIMSLEGQITTLEAEHVSVVESLKSEIELYDSLAEMPCVIVGTSPDMSENLRNIILKHNAFVRSRWEREDEIKQLTNAFDFLTEDSSRVKINKAGAIDELNLIAELAATDATLVNLAFGISESLGVAALKNSMQSFETFLRARDNKFITGMSIEWRTYLIKLLLGIDEPYRDIATANTLLGR